MWRSGFWVHGLGMGMKNGEREDFQHVAPVVSRDTLYTLIITASISSIASATIRFKQPVPARPPRLPR